MSVSTEIVRRVYNNEEGVSLEVGPGPDSNGISIRATDAKSVSWYGPVAIDYLSCEFAAKLGEALIAASKECKG